MDTLLKRDMLFSTVYILAIVYNVECLEQNIKIKQQYSIGFSTIKPGINSFMNNLEHVYGLHKLSPRWSRTILFLTFTHSEDGAKDTVWDVHKIYGLDTFEFLVFSPGTVKSFLEIIFQCVINLVYAP